MIYKFFASVIVVKGAARASICDLQRNQVHLIPNSLYAIVEDESIYFSRLSLQLSPDDIVVLREYIDHLLALELVFECPEEDVVFYPRLSLEWDFPAKISNVILDGSKDLRWLNEDLIQQFNEIGCRYLQVRLYAVAESSSLKRIAALIAPSEIRAIDFIVAENTDDDDFESSIIALVDEFKKIRSVIIHSAEGHARLKGVGQEFGTILKIKEGVKSWQFCGNIHHAYFSINVETFTESQHHNTCLNRKISIDVDGNIKNCPSMSKSYGNIRDTKLIDVVNNPEFQKVWHIKKDEITKCKDCEFRHVCTDCRAYLENPDDQYSAPLKCGYNPYTCEWEEWSTNPLKQKAIEFYGMQDLVKKS